MDERIWRVRPLGRVVAWLALLGSVPFVVMTAPSAFGSGRTGASVVFAVSTSLHAIACWRFGLHPRIVAGRRGIEVRNPFSIHFIAWDSVLMCRPGRSSLVIVQRDGRSVSVRAVQTSNRSMRADEVAYYLQRRSLLVIAARLDEASRRANAPDVDECVFHGGPRPACAPIRELRPSSQA